jgi:hypothetical protein
MNLAAARTADAISQPAESLPAQNKSQSQKLTGLGVLGNR